MDFGVPTRVKMMENVKTEKYLVLYPHLLIHRTVVVLFNYHHFCPSTRMDLGCLRGVMVKAMDCEIVVSEFELQLRYYVHFRTNTRGKGMNPLILPTMG